jgi:type I site-specific restriction endonuclease
MTNGLDTYFLEVGFAAKRLVAGFFTSDDLERLLFIRQNGKALGSIQISNTITDRAYQHEAIRRLSEAFEQGKRKALIVMATGSGKTRTAMSLIEFANRLVV